MIFNINEFTGEERAFLLEIIKRKKSDTVLTWDTVKSIKPQFLEKYLEEIKNDLTEEGLKFLDEIKEKYEKFLAR